MIKKIKAFIAWALQARWLWTNTHISILQHQRELLLQNERYQNPKRLNRYENQVFSQNGEDGIISEIYKRIGTASRVFLEIGVGDGLENNTTFLLQQGWKGIWIDGNQKSINFIKRHFQNVIQKGMLTMIGDLARQDNIVEILSKLDIPVDVDLLSLDIDRNTYFVLAPILSFLHPRVLVVEYNALYPPDIIWSVEYDSEKIWNRSSYSGASLGAYVALTSEYGYSLVGCDICGVNAFFVRNELLGDRFLPPYTAENHYEPLRDYLVHRKGPPRSFTDFY